MVGKFPVLPKMAVLLSIQQGPNPFPKTMSRNTKMTTQANKFILVSLKQTMDSSELKIGQVCYTKLAGKLKAFRNQANNSHNHLRLFTGLLTVETF